MTHYSPIMSDSNIRNPGKNFLQFAHFFLSFFFFLSFNSSFVYIFSILFTLFIFKSFMLFFIPLLIFV
jgi:hypothetical protein